MVGRLVLIVGPRGAGKTSLLQAARRRLKDDPRFVFPLRVISQPAAPGDERLHRTVTPAQFDCLRRTGRLALCWHRGGVNYALPAEIDRHLGLGRVVVAEAARPALPQARRRYPGVRVVAIGAPAAERRRRLARHDIGPVLAPDIGRSEVEADLVIENAGVLSAPAERLVAYLQTLADRAVPPEIGASATFQSGRAAPSRT